MKARYVIRKQFVDRVLSPEELAVMAELLVEWFVEASGPGLHQIQLTAEIYPIATLERNQLAQRLTSILEDSTLDVTVASELHVVGKVTFANAPPDITAWRSALWEPAVRGMCVRLGASFIPASGPLQGCTTKLVLCGQSMGAALLVKAIWPIRNVGSSLSYFARAWPGEGRFLRAFDEYTKAETHTWLEYAPTSSSVPLGRGEEVLFKLPPPEPATPRFMRRMYSLPADASAGQFLLYAMRLPFLAIFLLGGVMVAGRSDQTDVFQAGVIIGLAWLACVGFTLIDKAAAIGRHRSRWRDHYKQYFSKPLIVQQEKLPGSLNPTYAACSAELNAAGALHICDLSMRSHLDVAPCTSAYIWGDANVILLVAEKAADKQIFPGLPFISVATRFAGNGMHVTNNSDGFERSRNRQESKRCLPESDSIRDILDLHKREVDKLVASGATPLPAKSSFIEIAEILIEEHERDRELWKKKPISWSDAIHAAFKIVRREFMPD